MTLESFHIPGSPYGGSGMWSYRDAAGAMWFVYSGRNPEDNIFKQQVARFFKGKWKWYTVPVQFHGRPIATIEPSGLYITYMVNEASNDIRRWKVPDFVMPGYPTDGQSGPVPPTPPVEMVDATARADALQCERRIDKLVVDYEKGEKAQKEQLEALRAELNDLKRQVQQLQQRPTGGLTWLQIKDHLWSDNTIQDKVYLDLQQKGGIYGMIESLVKSLLK